MSTKAIFASAVLFALLLLIALFISIPRKPPQDITVRHVGSVQSSNITAMTFEIKNHTADPYIFFPFEVQIRNGNAWTVFQRFDMSTIQPIPKVNPNGLASYTVNVTNLPAGSVVRFSIRLQKTLLGVDGLVRRAELNLKKQGGGGKGISLNPYDRNSQVFGLPTEVVSEEFIDKGPMK